MLPDSIITVMAENCAKNLLMEGVVRGERAKLVRTVRRAIVQEMNVAQELEVEAEKIIRAHMGQVRSEGADVLYAPGLYSLEDIRTVVGELSKPLNLVMGFADPTLTLPQLADAGVRRISIGAGLSRIAMKAFLESARDMQAGNFGFVRDMVPITEFRDAFKS